MGKGYNNFMCKKPFHPGSRDNLKRVWCAQQKDVDDKQKEDELRSQYEKEQELYNNRLLVSTESKDKLSLNFMYEAPAGAKKEHIREDDEPEYKFEWQRNAPRESFAKGNMDIRDQPFGIQVRNVRCLKCHKWGHVNTDRECPLYTQSSSIVPSENNKVKPEELIRAMKEDGLALKKTLIGQAFDPLEANQLLLPKEEEDPEMSYLKSLSKKQKKKLLRKLDKLSGKDVQKKKKKSKSKRRSESPDKKSKSKKHKKNDSPNGEKTSSKRRSVTPEKHRNRRRSPTPEKYKRKKSASPDVHRPKDDRVRSVEHRGHIDKKRRSRSRSVERKPLARSEKEYSEDIRSRSSKHERRVDEKPNHLPNDTKSGIKLEPTSPSYEKRKGDAWRSLSPERKRHRHDSPDIKPVMRNRHDSPENRHSLVRRRHDSPEERRDRKRSRSPKRNRRDRHSSDRIGRHDSISPKRKQD